MVKLRSATPDRVIRALQACGFEVARQRGSHVVLWKRTGGAKRPIVIAKHSRELGPRVIAKILSQADISAEEFLEHL